VKETSNGNRIYSKGRYLQEVGGAAAGAGGARRDRSDKEGWM